MQAAIETIVVGSVLPIVSSSRLAPRACKKCAQFDWSFWADLYECLCFWAATTRACKLQTKVKCGCPQ